MLLIILLTAVNFATIAAALKAEPRMTMAIGMAGSDNDFYDDGSIVVRPYTPPGVLSRARPYLARPATIASRARRWGPVVVVASITAAIALISVNPALRRRFGGVTRAR